MPQQMGDIAMSLTTPTPTVKSQFWGTDYAMSNGINPLRNRLRRVLRLNSSRELKEMLNAAIAASTGEATVSTHYQIESATGNDLGGVRATESVNDMASATVTAAQNTSVLAETTYNPAPTYPGDASGNGK